MTETFPFLITGISFGLAAGVAPGPLLALVVSETLRHDKRHGILVAIAPVLTDIPIVLLSVYILGKLSGFNAALGIISLLGAAFISYLSYEGLTTGGIELNTSAIRSDSLKKGVLTNLLSPHPYLFWMTVGAPLIYRAYDASLQASVLFLLGFYLFLIGSKVALAVLVDRSKALLKSRTFVYLEKALGLLLMVFAILFFREGLTLLGLFQ
jgi:threonine/homoserine/homoserine lactone efflux protein